MSVELSKTIQGRDKCALSTSSGTHQDLESGTRNTSRQRDPNEHAFATDHLLANLKGRTISSGFVTITAQAARFLLNLGSTMIMARLLVPEEFGVVAMVTTVTALLSVFADAGLSTATLQREGITHAQVSNLFWINVGLSAVLALALAALSPVLAWFYHEPRVLGITLALSLNFLLAGSAAQHLALLSRQMRFKAKAFIEVASQALGVFVGIGTALLHCGYWSLVYASLTTTITMVLFTWTASRWRPQLPVRRSGTMPLVKFGADLRCGQSDLFAWAGNRRTLGGPFFWIRCARTLSRASVLLLRPLEQFLRPIDAVIEPALSRLQNHPERYRRMFLQAYEAIALAGFILAGLFMALAHPLILVALGSGWEKVGVIFSAFAVAALTFPVATATGWLFTSQGRGRDSLHARSLQGALSLLAFVVGLPFGPAGVALSFSLSCLVLQLPILYHLAGREGPVTRADLWRGFYRHLPVWIVVFGLTRLTCFLLPHSPPIVQVLVSTIAGLSGGAVSILLLAPSRRTALHLLDALRLLRRPRVTAGA